MSGMQQHIARSLPEQRAIAQCVAGLVGNRTLKRMNSQLPPIYFYSPPYKKYQHDLPASAAQSWEWELEKGLYEYGVEIGEYCWTLQTYLRLQEAGFPCELTDTFPQEGIVLVYRESIDFRAKPNDKTLLVCMLGGKAPHPYAQINVTQNPQGVYTKFRLLGDLHDPRVLGTRSRPIPGKHYITLWPQPGIVPRDPARGDRFENAAYMGVGAFLAPEMQGQTWRQQVAQLGINWSFKGLDESKDSWTNYSEVDAVIAVRSFAGKTDFPWKPASKLFQAWEAGVPAIMGCESAYRAVRKSKLDYLEVSSPAETLEALKRLRDDPGLRQAMAENGRTRAREATPQQLLVQWQDFFTNVLIPEYERWCQAPGWQRALYFQRREFDVARDGMRRFLELKADGVQRRLKAAGLAK